MQQVIEQRHKKQLAVMRGFLEGRRFFKAYDALELVKETELGLRKDGQTPKLHHQLSVGRLITTLEPHLLFPEESIASAFLHDLLEDHHEWKHSDLVCRFGERIADAVGVLTKKDGSMLKDKTAYFAQMSLCPIASVVKLADRGYNLQTMGGVFSSQKKLDYCDEVDTFFFPMIRTARRKFPSQYGAYENLKILLRCQTTLVREYENAIRSYKSAQGANQ